MRPKTKLQKEVWEFHKRLPYVDDQNDFVISKHEFYYTTHYKNLICLECNHTWKPAMQFWAEEMAGVKCPCCDKKLKKIEIRNGCFVRIITYSVVQVVDRFQVVRYFSCWKNMYKNKAPRYHFRELFEEWKDYDKNKKVIVGRNISWTGDGFSSSDYEVRYINQKYWKQNEYESFASDFNCPGSEFLPRFSKYGLGDDFHNCDWRFLISRLEMYSEIETLLKAKNKELLFHAVHKDLNFQRFWPQIKIVLRHKYKIKDAGIWYDYLALLQYFKKDIYNPVFVLPKNLHKAHNELMAKKAKIDAIERARKEELRQQEERARAEKEAVLKDIKEEVFKDFKFRSGKIVVVALVKENDVLEEGKKLKHCVHSSEYHKKAGILLMSARLEGKRLETIEISLSSYSIIQCRGKDNKPTPYHDEIIAIVRRNMSKISKAVEKETKLKEAVPDLLKFDNRAA